MEQQYDRMEKTSCFQLDAPEETREWHEKALQLLAQHQIPPAPVCHLIAYQYASGRTAALNQRIDQHLKAKDSLDGHLFHHLFEEFYLDEQGAQQIDEHLSDLHSLLFKVLQGVTSACDHAQQYDETVRRQTHALSENPSLQDLSAIASTLLEASNRSLLQNRGMREQLQSVERQTQNLQHEVHKLQQEVATDPLTGLYNRKALSQRMESLLASVIELQEAPFSVLMLDIDHFKHFNDRFGHIIGDEVIRRVGATIKELIRKEDFPARFGGEEFTVVLPATGIDDAMHVACTIHQAIGNLTLIRRSTQERLPGITISVGAAQLHQGDDCETLLERADQALYQAKAEGRNRIVTEADISYM